MTDSTYKYRRKSDDNPIRQFWDWATPWLQVSGFVIMCSFIIGTNYSKFEAQAMDIATNKTELQQHNSRLMALEMSNSRIDQKLDDIIRFWNIPHREK